MNKLLFLAVFSLFFLSGCRQEELGPAPESLFVLTDGVTADGIQAGDGRKEFCRAYQDYEILVSLSQSDIPHEPMPIWQIPYQKDPAAMIANFFIDGVPQSPQDICEAEKINEEDLFDLLSSEEYLRGHEVLYRYLIFYWKDGVIDRIASEELNYNETYEVPAGW